MGKQKGPKGKESNAPQTTKVSDKKNNSNDNEIEKISIWTHPITTLRCFGIVLFRFAAKIGRHILSHFIIYSLLAAALIVPHVVKGPHTPYVEKFDEIAEFAIYWIILGIASSIGLGTGLHTFVLYTGPHIAKFTMMANECNAVPEFLPSRWAINPYFAECPPGDRPTISFWDIFFVVYIEAFLWGAGTAIGELPPYFVAKAASLAGKKDEELQQLEEGGAETFIDKAKLAIFRNLKKYGWWTILACASIPNPLFDLAGITCGHFGIPFITFFSATLLGKAVNKTLLQTCFVIFLFSNHHVENLLGIVERNIPFLHGSLSSMLNKQKELLKAPKSATLDQKPFIAVLWDYVIMFMIGAFLVSIVNSLANNYYEEEQAEKKKKKK